MESNSSSHRAPDGCVMLHCEQGVNRSCALAMALRCPVGEDTKVSLLLCIDLCKVVLGLRALTDSNYRYWILTTIKAKRGGMILFVFCICIQGLGLTLSIRTC